MRSRTMVAGIFFGLVLASCLLGGWLLLSYLEARAAAAVDDAMEPLVEALSPARTQRGRDGMRVEKKLPTLTAWRKARGYLDKAHQNGAVVDFPAYHPAPYSLADEPCPVHQTRDMPLHYLMAHGMAQHGPSDPKDCEHFCSPSGDVGDAPEGVEQIKCPGNNADNSCTRQGAQCSREDRPGCSTNCKTQCCGCCSI